MDYNRLFIKKIDLQKFIEKRTGLKINRRTVDRIVSGEKSRYNGIAKEFFEGYIENVKKFPLNASE